MCCLFGGKKYLWSTSYSFCTYGIAQIVAISVLLSAKALQKRKNAMHTFYVWPIDCYVEMGITVEKNHRTNE